MSRQLTFDLTLGPELGRGGQGVVHDLPNAPGFAAKRYLTPPDQRQRRHLHHLIAHASPRLMAIAAWPAGLHLAPTGEDLLVMPEIPRAREIHDFYGPASRDRYFPGASRTDCFKIAEQVAAIVGEIHAAGFIVADLNEQNFLVSRDLKVTLIDCDSLMSRHDGRETYGGPYRDEWLAPELIGIDLGDVERTHNHDNFGLAMMLFRILMQGRHPFIGRPTGSTDLDETEAIRTHQFVYGGQCRTMAVPANAPSFGSLPEALQRLFLAAFEVAGRQRRPAAKEWQRAIEDARYAEARSAGVSPQSVNTANATTSLQGLPRIETPLLSHNQRLNTVRPESRLPPLPRQAIVLTSFRGYPRRQTANTVLRGLWLITALAVCLPLGALMCG